eukprot:TRINITY_DN72066_c0_g1_i1.p1 TRINITY_DN72066_c0_g1~~TRINITY_DN72066_c0_g1_i1.p1  ORF type:complete len:683 (-),score=62.84 TRINITY_DN72066_c0_g1_i1:586-2400(-)
METSLALADATSEPEDEVISKACDIELSEHLSRRELRQALHACGLYPEEVQLDQVSPASFVPRAMFGALKGELSRCACRHGPKIVPHARRGIHLSQLQDLNQAFVKSGWLATQCRQHEEAFAHDIAEGTVRPHQENLYALCEFVVVPATCPNRYDRLPSTIRNDAGMVSPPARDCSYAELLNPTGVQLDVMVSHFWGHSFHKTLRSLELYAEKSLERIGKSNTGDVTYWICLFAINQHRADEEVGSNPEHGPFNAAIKKAALGVAMIVDELVCPLSRIWCLYEVQRSRDLGASLHLISEHGMLTAIDTGNQGTPGLREMQFNVAQNLTRFSAYSACASVLDDKLSIWYRIANPWVRDLKSYSDFKDMRKREDMFEEFNTSVSALLANVLFQSFLDKRDGASACQCLGLGAECGSSGLQAIEACGGNLQDHISTRFSKSCKLTHAMAFFGRVDAMKYLLSIRADASAIDNDDGFVPLHMAARRGHSETVAMLLDHRVDAAVAARSSGCTPLHRAAYAGHEPIVEMLLLHRASCEARDSDCWTPLRCAAVRGHELVVKTMLQSTIDKYVILQAASATKYKGVSELLRAHAREIVTIDESEEDDIAV